jgi:NAD+ synthase (glutamine-hydrolysing)
MFGFYRLAAAVPRVYLADPASNAAEIIKLYNMAADKGAAVVLFPEMSITGYTVGDLVFQKQLLNAAREALLQIADATAGKHCVAIVGLPIEHNGRLYNCAAVIQNGVIAGIVPKQQLVNYREYSEKRFFSSGRGVNDALLIGDQAVPFGWNLLFDSGDFAFGVELCEDLWSVTPPSDQLALAGATAIFNPACCTETAGKAALRADLIKAQSRKLCSAYLFAAAGMYESTTDNVRAGDSMIAVNGEIVARGERFARESTLIYADADMETLVSSRRTDTSFYDTPLHPDFTACEIGLDPLPEAPDFTFAALDPAPMLPKGADAESVLQDILNIQICGLMRRFEHSRSKCMVIGVSGGLDSTLALLVAAECVKRLNLPADTVKAFTMPGFGTTKLTRGNSEKLCDCLGIPVKAVDITPACLQHFADIGHDPANHSTAYENVQARERTQILMDAANEFGGMVIGTGDLSEGALGWCTYNGDHMSMYAVNGSIPKTLIREIVRYAAEKSGGSLAEVLQSILATPVSPELLPPDAAGKIEQKTEDIIGPYELHDFFIWHFIKNNSTPEKIAALAREAFKDTYSAETIEKTLKIFLRRFFQQQFKRSCMPDGAAAAGISLSPRNSWQMPSDAIANLWLD